MFLVEKYKEKSSRLESIKLVGYSSQLTKCFNVSIWRQHTTQFLLLENLSHNKISPVLAFNHQSIPRQHVITFLTCGMSQSTMYQKLGLITLEVKSVLNFSKTTVFTHNLVQVSIGPKFYLLAISKTFFNQGDLFI